MDIHSALNIVMTQVKDCILQHSFYIKHPTSPCKLLTWAYIRTAHSHALYTFFKRRINISLQINVPRVLRPVRLCLIRLVFFRRRAHFTLLPVTVRLAKVSAPSAWKPIRPTSNSETRVSVRVCLFPRVAIRHVGFDLNGSPFLVHTLRT